MDVLDEIEQEKERAWSRFDCRARRAEYGGPGAQYGYKEHRPPSLADIPLDQVEIIPSSPPRNPFPDFCCGVSLRFDGRAVRPCDGRTVGRVEDD